jgi:hypothetical protein
MLVKLNQFGPNFANQNGVGTVQLSAVAADSCSADVALKRRVERNEHVGASDGEMKSRRDFLLRLFNCELGCDEVKHALTDGKSLLRDGATSVALSVNLDAKEAVIRKIFFSITALADDTRAPRAHSTLAFVIRAKVA